MVEPGQRDTANRLNQSFIVKSKKLWIREILIAIFTLLLWCYCVTVVYFYLDALLSLNHYYPRLFKIVFKMTNFDIKNFLKMIGFLFALIFFSLLIWRYYNRKKYGGLTRRQYPGLTTKEELLKLNMIDEKTYEELQNSKVIVFEKNPIKD